MGKSEKPICRSMNFSVYSDMLNRYRDSADIIKSYEKCGLNGLEVIRAGEDDHGKILPGMVNGVHLYFHIFWMDWWKGDHARLDAEFDSREQWMEYFGGKDKESYLNSLRSDLQYAETVGARYVVFHVSEVTLRESYEFKYRYTDEEVIDTSLEIINTLLSERDYPFDFLVENLWWSGFTLLDVKLTKRLIEGICSEKKGIMLDTGHYMNTSCELRTAEDGVWYINQMLDEHEQAGLLQWVKGMHLQMSLGGDYVKKFRREWEIQPLNFEEIPFYELFGMAYAHACSIDKHQPFLGRGVRKMVERVHPDYITFEFVQNNRNEYEDYACAQAKELGYV